MPTTSHDRRRALARLALLCAAACASAAPAARGQRAHKIDETLNTRCDLSEVARVTDRSMPLFVELDRHPEAKAAVVVYAPLPGDAMSYARQVGRWLTEARGVAPGRLLDVYGGPAAEKRLELWLVPAGAAPPPAAPPVARAGVTLFDRFTYWGGESCDSDRRPALEVFAETLRSLPGWRGTVVVRPHVNRRGAKTDDKDWSPPLTRRGASLRAAADRLHLVRQLGLPPPRIRAVVGAPSDWPHAELWLIPPAASAR
jgi:hypothetical protein